MFDYATMINDAIWTALKSSTDFCSVNPPAGTGFNKVYTKNMLNFSGGAPIDSMLPFIFGDLYNDNSALAFPRAVLYQGEIVDGMYSAQPSKGSAVTFGMMSAGGPADWFNPVQINFTLTLIFRSCRLDQNNPLKIAAVTAIKKLGPRLGLNISGTPFVTMVGPVMASAEKMLVPPGRNDNGFPIGQIRSQCDIKIPVSLKFDGPQLLSS
jgi:hypothetical protein